MFAFSFDTKPKQLEVDVTVYTHETSSLQLTFNRKEIESRGIDWRQFVKSANEVFEELKIKAAKGEQTTQL